MNYSLIALDLDGTLTNSDKQVSPLTRRALLRAQDEGTRLILASGRPTQGIEPVARCLELAERGGYVLPYNGGQIVEWATRRVIYEKHVPADGIALAHEYACSHGFALVGYVGRELLTETPDDPYVQEESRINQMAVRRVDCLPEHLGERPPKLLLTGAPERLVTAEAELAELLRGRMEAFRSAPFFVEIVPPGIDKGQSLTRLLALLRLRPADLMAFGDGYNDLTMLRLAGMGVAMGNAAPEVRAAADYVTGTNDADGIAHALREVGGLEEK